VLLATHDPRVAASADRVLQLRDGLLVEETRLEGGDPAEAVVSSLLRLEV
jgi:putative ABC transport system ATP-binding protein